MTILGKPALVALLDELLAEGEAGAARMRKRYAAMPPDSFAKIIAGEGYREFYASVRDEPLALSREVYQLLYIQARSSGAQHIIEFGTSFGFATLFLAAALRDNGGGLLITTEFEPTKLVRARQNIADANLTDLVEFREGDALSTLKDNLPERIDLVLLDGAKHQFSDVLSLVESRLRPGALILADNADWNPTYLQRVRSRKAGYLSVPVGADIELAMRLT